MLSDATQTEDAYYYQSCWMYECYFRLRRDFPVRAIPGGGGSAVAETKNINITNPVICTTPHAMTNVAAMQRKPATALAVPRTWRSLIALVVLVAFGLQSFLVQTHLHNLPLSLQPMGAATAATPGDAKAPLDADKCYLCQEFLHGGTYLTPAAVAVLPPSAAVSLLPLVLAPVAVKRAVSHNWMGRAPPRAPVSMP